jgi:hypothetical protein
MGEWLTTNPQFAGSFPFDPLLDDVYGNTVSGLHWDVSVEAPSLQERLSTFEIQGGSSRAERERGTTQLFQKIFSAANIHVATESFVACFQAPLLVIHQPSFCLQSVL